MIVVAVQGSLGDQLFQYAFAKAVEKTLSREVFLMYDASGPATNTTRELDHFNIDLRALSPEQRQRLFPRKPKGGFAARILKRIPTLFVQKPDPLEQVVERHNLFPFNHLYHEQSAQAFSPEYYRQGQDILSLLRRLETEKDYVFQGLWQSAAMVDHVRDEIEGFTFISKPSAGTCALLERIKHLQSPVALHMKTNWQRHDDGRLFNRPISRQRVLPLSYYQQAISRVREKYPDSTFMVFADDIDTAASLLDQLDMPDRFIYADTTGRQVWEDLFLMKHCRHFILSNSTFAWWGCWFGTREKTRGHLCIMPRDWLGYHTGKLLAARFQMSKDCIHLQSSREDNSH